MKKRQNALEWLKHPHGWLLVVFYVFAALVIAGAVALCVLGTSRPTLRYVSYGLFALSAVMVGYLLYTLIYLARVLKPRVAHWAKNNEFVQKLVHRYGFRTIIFTIGSLCISFSYAVFNAIIAVISHSIWYGALAAYYALLAIIRGGVIFHHRKKRKMDDEDDKEIYEIRTYRRCGGLLIFLPLALGGAIMQMVLSDKSFTHPGLTIYFAAVYTFYKIIMAIINLRKARKNDDMTIQAVRNVNFADALVSMLALQTALLHAFSPERNYHFANALTGTAVCVITTVIGIVMIVHANITLKQFIAAQATPAAPQAGEDFHE